MALSSPRRTTGTATIAIGCLLFGIVIALMAMKYPGTLAIMLILFLSSTIIGLGIGILINHPLVGAFVGFAFWCLVFGIIGLAIG